MHVDAKHPDYGYMTEQVDVPYRGKLLWKNKSTKANISPNDVETTTSK